MSDEEMDVSDDCSIATSESIIDTPDAHLEKCLFGNKTIDLPIELLEFKSIWQKVVSADMWKNELTEEQRNYLMEFLPNFTENDVGEKEESLRQLFDYENFHFGTPLDQFYHKLKDGNFSPDIARYNAIHRKSNKREHGYRQQEYYHQLLKDVLMNRQTILDHYNHHPIDVPVPPIEPRSGTPPKERRIHIKSKRRYLKILAEIRGENGDEGDSSDEEFLAVKAKKIRALEQSDFGVQSTFATQTDNMSIMPIDFDQISSKLSKAMVEKTKQYLDFNENDYQDIVYDHKEKRKSDEEYAELEVTGLSLSEILHRTQPTKKALLMLNGAAKKKSNRLTNEKKKINLMGKDKLTVMERSSVKMDLGLDDSLPSGSFAAVTPPTAKGTKRSRTGSILRAEDPTSDVNVDDIDVEMFDPDSSTPSYLKESTSCFFSLIRDIIKREPEGKIHTNKLVELIRAWQSSSFSSMNGWFNHVTDWVELIEPAAKFLSGDVMGLEIDNFIPMLDFKERTQHWKWIGEDRDDDRSLVTLNDYWFDHRLNETIQSIQDNQDGDPLPPRVKTDYIVKPSTDEEKEIFRKQESLRFENPQNSFTYDLHGYKSIVGPVKGIYSKDMAVNKPREHALLVANRLPYVTILNLVRDAVARLPNGEGTRNDICELMKDSQYLATDVNDGQMSNVVSGALDRLHYEKDPCVKFDGARKLWIFLHRNRSENQYARIHQAQGIVAKAKKSLLKPKILKVKKAVVTTIGSGAPTTTTPTVVTAANIKGLMMKTPSKNPSRQAIRVTTPGTLNTSASILKTPSTLNSAASLLKTTPGSTLNTAASILKTIPTPINTTPTILNTALGTPNTVPSSLNTVPSTLKTSNGQQIKTISIRGPGGTSATAIPHGYSIVTGGPGNRPMLVQSTAITTAVSTVTIATKSTTASVMAGAAKTVAAAVPSVTSSLQNVIISNAAGKILTQQQLVHSTASTITTNTVVPDASKGLQRVSLTSQRIVRPGTVSPGGATVRPQTVTISSLLAQQQQQRQQQQQNVIKLQGGNVLQAVSGGKTSDGIVKQPQLLNTSATAKTPVTVKTSQVIGSTNQIIQDIQGNAAKPKVAAGVLPTQILTPGGGAVRQIFIDGKPHIFSGKTPTVVSGKPTAVLGSKPTTVLGGKPTAFLGGKPATGLGGKPATVIGGKPATVLGGKPATVIGGKPTTVISGKPAAMMGGKPVRLIRGQSPQVVLQTQNVQNVSLSGITSTVTSTLSNTNQSALISQLVRAGSNIQLARPAVTVRPASSQSNVQIMTQLRGATALQAGQLGQRIILQPSQAGQILSPQIITGATGVRQQAASGTQNIQIVRSPQPPGASAGGKPAQVFARILQTPGVRIAQVRAPSALQKQTPKGQAENEK